MPDQTTVLSLPMIMPSQAQKHVTHNEALRLLDVAVQLAVLNRTRTTPPALPAVGDRHIVAAGASGDWAGRAGDIALYGPEGWEFHTPLPGWRAHVLAEAQTAVFDGTGWDVPGQGPLAPSQLGVNTTADAVNRLAVSSDASLFNHDGGGHQVKVNKAAAAQTASVLFQSAFSGRAEAGLIGSNDFALKVSGDGTTFSEALKAAAGTGIVTLPKGARVAPGSESAPGLSFDGDSNTGLYRAGPNAIGLATGSTRRVTLDTAALQVDVPVTGSAVQASAVDATVGRLLRMTAEGVFGLGGACCEVTSLDALAHSGFYRITAANALAGGAPLALGFSVVHVQHDTANATQIAQGLGVGPRSFQRNRTNGVWDAWREAMHQGSMTGTVSEAAGVPTGAIIERGANANGDYVRYADGTQICWNRSIGTASTLSATGSLFNASSNLVWTFPAAFVAAPIVTGRTIGASTRWVVISSETATDCALRPMSSVSSSTALSVGAMAIGRWF